MGIFAVNEQYSIINLECYLCPYRPFVGTFSLKIHLFAYYLSIFLKNKIVFADNARLNLLIMLYY